MKTLEVIVDAKGEVSVQTKGFTGSSCREASKALEQALVVADRIDDDRVEAF